MRVRVGAGVPVGIGVIVAVEPAGGGYAGGLVRVGHAVRYGTRVGRVGVASRALSGLDATHAASSATTTTISIAAIMKRAV
jgi:hypothetical protein